MRCFVAAPLSFMSAIASCLTFCSPPLRLLSSCLSSLKAIYCTVQYVIEVLPLLLPAAGCAKMRVGYNAIILLNRADDRVL